MQSQPPNPFQLAARLLIPSATIGDFGTPGELAAAINPTTVQTPALSMIDDALVDVDRAIEVMVQRQARAAALVSVGMGKEEATERAALEVPSTGTDRLLISMPPQEGKSTRVTHYGVLWLLRRHPHLRVVIISYGDSIARRWSYNIRSDIAAHDGTRGAIDLGLRISRDSRAASHWALQSPARGNVDAIGLYGSITGLPVELLVIDDPVKDFRAADSMALSEQAWQTYMAVAHPRLAPGGQVIVVLTRWHENDLGGRLLQKQEEDRRAGLEHYDTWRVINVPAQADHDPATGATDPLDREPGEFMLSARGRTRAQWEAVKAATSPRIWTALYQGRPSPERGDVFHRGWWRRYDSPLWRVEADGSYRVRSYEGGQLVQSWDMTFKDSAGTDYVVGQVWFAKGGVAWLLDQVRGRMDFPTTQQAVVRLSAKWPQAALKLVESTANGPAVIASLRTQVSGLVPVTPVGGKPARARAVSPFVEAGDVVMPTADVALFDVEELILEATLFPNGAHDDQVDALTQALDRVLLMPAKGVGWANWEQQQIDLSRSRCQGTPDGIHRYRNDHCLYCGQRQQEEPFEDASDGAHRDGIPA